VTDEWPPPTSFVQLSLITVLCLRLPCARGDVSIKIDLKRR